MEEHNIDKFFQEKLNNHSATPSDKVWKGISEGLDKQQKKAGFFNVSRLGLILILLLFAGSTGYLMYRVQKLDKAVKLTSNELNESKKSTLPELTPVVASDSLNKSEERKEVSGNRSGTESNRGESHAHPSLSTSDFDKSSHMDVSPENTERAQNKSANQSAMSLAGNGRREKDKPDHEAKAEINLPTRPHIDTTVNLSNMSNDHTGSNPAYMVNQTHKYSTENAGLKGETAITPYEGFDHLDIKPMDALGITLSYFGPDPDFPDQTPDYYTMPTHKFTLGAYGIVSSNYRRVTARNESDELVSLLNNAEKTAVNQGGGFSLHYDLSNHWRIGIGIEYRTRVQEGSYPVVLEFENVEFTNASPNSELGWAYAENLESSFGNADFEIMDYGYPYGAIGLSTPPAEYLTQVSMNRTQQVFHMPIGAEYGLNAGSWRFLTGAGLAWDRVLSDRTVLSATEFENISFSAPPTTVGNYFSYHIGLAVEYSLTERISIRINPRYESWLTPVFQNDNLRTLPYSLSMAAGIGIRL